jgi:hypothetical protein
MSRLMKGVFAGLILFAVSVAYITIPKENVFATNSDEGQYFNYAKGVSQKGISYIPVLLQKYMATPSAQLLPHPGRVGHTLVTALWFKVFPRTYRSLAHLSFVCFALFLWVSFVFARKYLGTDIALWYTTLLSSSPLLMAASRRVLQDSVLNLFWALPFWFFFDYAMSGKKRSLWIFCATLAFAITIKEQSVVLVPLFAAAWLGFRFFLKKNMPWGDFLIMLFVPLAAAVVLLVVFLGGINNFVTVVDFILGVHLSSNELNSYSYFAIGPWFKFLIDFMLLSPLATLLFVGYFFHLLIQKKLDAVRAYGLVFFLVVFGVFSSLYHTKIVRFVVSLEIVMFLFAVFALLEIFNFKNKRWAVHGVSISVFLILLLNILYYNKIFVEMRTYDPISVWLLLGHKILPYYYFRPG